jgi:hypothetical protein
MPWNTKLARPVMVKNGPTLKALRDVRAYALELSPYRTSATAWRRTMELLLEAAENGKPEAVTTQLETALFLEGNLKLG